MRLAIGGGRTALLTYCANVHPGERLTDVWAALDAAADVRERVGLDLMAIGLWLSRPALDELVAGVRPGGQVLAGELARRGLEVFTFNGFPYGNFHAPVVKRAVYHPDWTTRERVAYTLALAAILAEVLPAGLEEGTISTVPLAHRGEIADPGAEQAALDQLCRLTVDLARLADRTGSRVRVVCEPEPGCLLETTADAIEWWTSALPAAARRTGVPANLLADHLGLCFDTCHQAVAFEDPRASLDALAAAGVPIGKMQLSSSLVIPSPGAPAGRAALARFAEPRFLHQVRALGKGGALAAADDLDQVADLPVDRPWRVHFHVPIHRAAVGEVETTREFLRGAIAWLRAPGRPLPHLEVETYTWSVLPESERPADTASLCAGLAAELTWAMHELSGEAGTSGQEPGAP